MPERIADQRSAGPEISDCSGFSQMKKGGLTVELAVHAGRVLVDGAIPYTRTTLTRLGCRVIREFPSLGVGHDDPRASWFLRPNPAEPRSDDLRDVP